MTNSQMDTFLYGDPLTSPVFTLASLPLRRLHTIGSVLCSRRVGRSRPGRRSVR
ncbi:hypothetical protein OG223_41250 [Streptomyces sp. NBC_01478]|uniref:hypothetical protein n=1 Tax=Streptomyces sp. NBC_01478 TaxID=2903882 RepID=UPI002E353E13|nr:hypothetical protein [Streptomyces sp. NBC_01478]